MNSPSKKILNQLMNEWETTENISIQDFLFHRLVEIERIITACKSIQHNKQVILEEYELKKKALGDQLKELQAKCKHEEFTFHGDPSGNNDSFSRCDICGKEW